MEENNKDLEITLKHLRALPEIKDKWGEETALTLAKNLLNDLNLRTKDKYPEMVKQMISYLNERGVMITWQGMIMG